jgi:hypothetical protein
MIRSLFALLLSLSFLTVCGCAGYQMGSPVSKNLRTVHVPVFENRTDFPMAGAVASQQFLDVMIEEGTFVPTPYDEARLRVQVVINGFESNAVRYDRNNHIQPNEYYLSIIAKLYVFDAITGKPYIDGKTVRATESMLTRNQFQNAVQDTLPRLSRQLAKLLLDELQTIQE